MIKVGNINASMLPKGDYFLGINAYSRRSEATIQAAYYQIWSAFEVNSSVDNRYDWDGSFLPNRSWKLRLHSWQYFVPHLEVSHALMGKRSRRGDGQYLFDLLNKWIIDWIKTFDGHGGVSRINTDLDPWAAIPTALRLPVLHYLLKRPDKFDDVTYSLLERSSNSHFDVLAEKFQQPNVEVLASAARLLHLCYLSKRGEGISGEFSQFLERFHLAIERGSTPSGVWKEHSPSYQANIVKTLLVVVENLDRVGQGSEFLLEKLGNMQIALKSMTFGDEVFLVPFGDTSPRSLRELLGDNIVYNSKYIDQTFKRRTNRSASTLKKLVDYDAGFISCRSNNEQRESLFISQSAFFSNYHKHSDDGNIFWSYQGVPILNDAGFFLYGERTQGKNAGRYDDVRRRFIESNQAHNSVEVSGISQEAYLARPFDGSSVRAFFSPYQDYLLTHFEVQIDRNTIHYRTVICHESSWVLIIDEVRDLSNVDRKVTQWTQLFPAMKRVDNALCWKVDADQLDFAFNTSDTLISKDHPEFEKCRRVWTDVAKRFPPTLSVNAAFSSSSAVKGKVRISNGVKSPRREGWTALHEAILLRSDAIGYEAAGSDVLIGGFFVLDGTASTHQFDLKLSRDSTPEKKERTIDARLYHNGGKERISITIKEDEVTVRIGNRISVSTQKYESKDWLISRKLNSAVEAVMNNESLKKTRELFLDIIDTDRVDVLVEASKYVLIRNDIEFAKQIIGEIKKHSELRLQYLKISLLILENLKDNIIIEEMIDVIEQKPLDNAEYILKLARKIFDLETSDFYDPGRCQTIFEHYLDLREKAVFELGGLRAESFDKFEEAERYYKLGLSEGREEFEVFLARLDLRYNNNWNNEGIRERSLKVFRKHIESSDNVIAAWEAYKMLSMDTSLELRESEAISHLILAAKSGHRLACFEYGNILMQGGDKFLARRWWKVSADAGYEPAREALQELRVI